MNKQTNYAIALILTIVMVFSNGLMTVLADHPRQMTGGGDDVLDPGETLSGTEEWGDSAVFSQGYLQFTVDASAAVAGEDITFTYTPTGGTTYNNSNIMMNISNSSNGDSCWQINFSGTDPVDCVISGATGGGTYTIDIYHNNGSPCDQDPAVTDQASCDAADYFSTMDATATGGSGGAVPEFSDYLYALTLFILIGFMVKLAPKITEPVRLA